MTDWSEQAFVYTVANAQTGEEEHYLSPAPPELASRLGLPLEAIFGRLVAGPDAFEAEHFAPNPRFTSFLHQVLAKHAARCPGLATAVERQRDGYVSIIDGRTTTPDGAVPPGDVIGVVEVRDGKMTRYQGNPDYRVFTNAGIMKLDPWFQSKLLDEIAALGNVEQ